MDRGSEALFGWMRIDDENAQGVKLRRARRDVLPSRGLAFGGDEKLNVRRFRQKLADLVLNHPVGVGDPLAQMHELQPGFDQIGFLEPSNFGRVLENAPGEGAVAPAFVAQFVDGPQELGAVLRDRYCTRS